MIRSGEIQQIAYEQGVRDTQIEKDIKLDISTNELIYFPVEEHAILDTYSDREAEYKIKAYSLEESLVEKLRCVLQRKRPSNYT